MIFGLFDGCEVLDLAGPLQTFGEAAGLGAEYTIRLCAPSSEVVTDQGLTLSRLQPLPRVAASDRVIVPGFRLVDSAVPASLGSWLRTAVAAGAHVCSVCTGAFALGEAGLLDGRACTTHWKYVGELQRRFRRARVLEDRLFVTDGPVTTSAGIASGIDMALALVEEDYGPLLASRVAREMVVYLRRDAAQSQRSVYLDYRTHLDSGVHEVQDHLVAHPEARASLAALARIGRTSPRTLTRSFRRATGISIGAFRTRVRLERARMLMNDPHLTLEAVADQCGFGDARQLRRAWSRAHGRPPRRERPARSRKQDPRR